MLLAQGQTIWQVHRSLEISEQSYYRWRRECGGMDTAQAKKIDQIVIPIATQLQQNPTYGEARQEKSSKNREF